MFVSKKHHANLCSGFTTQWDEDSFTDISLIAKETATGEAYSYNCHKVVLSVASGYLSQKLVSSPEVNHLDLGVHVKREVLHQALHFMYSEKCELKDIEIGDLMDISVQLEVQHLTEECEQYMLATCNITTDTVVDFYEMATKYGCSLLKKKNLDYISYHFTELFKAKQLRKLSLENISTVLSLDVLNAESEDQVFLCAVDWLEAHPEHEAVDDLLRLIRYKHITKLFFCNTVQYHPLMQKEPRRDYVKKVTTSHLGFKSNLHGVPRKKSKGKDLKSNLQLHCMYRNVLACVLLLICLMVSYKYVLPWYQESGDTVSTESYHVFRSASQTRASQSCQERGMRLATIANEYQEKAIIKYLRPYNIDGGIWVGARRDDRYSTFRWSADGTRVSDRYTNWADGEPHSPYQECMEILPKRDYKWKSDECFLQKYFLCEHVTE